ncbi:arylamine N-acetyltransferase family protein [Nocardiopsis ganjiahuensis]|uniref:arylamine N-acetyltransferase family protein n=1 Tax=Nocardiopsis ganjiahuensis TaxID=239984 RepID=UPI000349BB20|nr:arylamine N-acetyltransferase [Nocardiopsis ganjiahuensis]
MTTQNTAPNSQNTPRVPEGHSGAGELPDLSARWDSDPLDLAAYLERIGYDGPLDPTLATLRALQAAHLEAIPFEGINPYLGLPVPLDIGSLQDKLVHGRRGGYCHEQNILFGTVLDRLGFQVTGRNARMLMGADEGVMTARGHAVLSVVIDGTDWHVDVGIGNVGPREPVPLTEGARVATGPWEYRMDRTDLGHWLLRYRRPGPGDWFNVVQFTEERHYRSDYEDANIIAATHGSSPFTQQPVVAHNGARVRRSLAGRTLNTYLPNGEKHTREISAEDVPETLRSVFGVHLSEARERELVERLRDWTGPDPDAAPHGQ